MGMLSTTYTKSGYLFDSIFYISVIISGIIALIMSEPAAMILPIFVFTCMGLFTWTILEYFIHRFILHGNNRLQRAHMLHHDNPHELIAAPTLLGASLFLIVMYIPLLLLTNFWIATSITVGNIIGYVYYGWMHYAVHRQAPSGYFMKHRKKIHAKHHHKDNMKNFGVTSDLWDAWFKTN